jgi:hypothetical protein
MGDEELVGIYDADGGLSGELRYVVGKVAGRTHCALCDITHSWRGRKSAWDSACDSAGLSVRLLHRNEATAAQLAAAGPLPAVLVNRDGAWVLVLDPEKLDGCGGDPDRFTARLLAALGGPMPSDG